MELLELQNVKNIQSFLEFYNFYQCFIDQYSNIVILLIRLTQKGAARNFSDDCQTLFWTFKKSLTSAPILAYWIPDLQIVVETNASDYAPRAILFIYTPNSELHLITFHSCTFTLPKLNYNIHDKKLLPIFETFKTWQHYLEGFMLLIDVVTNHKNLTYFSTTKILT